jgi:glutathione-specific gamma-glutamylcyclotransferase
MRTATSTNRLAIFAYGSLLYRPGFAFAQRARAVAHGFARRFSQASPDHRGTPEQPGRVLTLVPRADARTVGAVYFVEDRAETLLSELDHRERAGYERVAIEVLVGDDAVNAVTWIAPPGNVYDVGQLPLEQLAAHVKRSTGPSGRNDEYVYLLEAALRELEAEDELVTALSALLRG